MCEVPAVELLADASTPASNHWLQVRHLGQAPPFETGPFEQVSAGAKMTCAIRKGKAGLRCWGHDHFDVHRPPNATFEQVTINTLHACGLTVDSSVKCWGNTAADAHAVPPSFVAA